MQFTTDEKLITFRKQTRALAKAEFPRLREVLSALIPLANPYPLLGDTIFGGNRVASPKQKQAGAEFLELVRKTGAENPFRTGTELSPPFDVSCAPIEFHPWQYPYVVSGAEGKKTVAISSPLKWMLSYPGCGPVALRQALAKGEGVERLLTHAVLLNFSIKRHATMLRIL